MSHDLSRRAGRLRNPPAPPAPEKPKRKVGSQSKKDQQAYNEALRVNEANVRIQDPELATTSASVSVPSLGHDHASRNIGYDAKTKSTAAFPPNPFFRKVDIDEAESTFTSEFGQSEEHPRCRATVWQDLWKMSLHLFGSPPQAFLQGRLDLSQHRAEEMEVYRELIFVLAHPCWERDVSLVRHALGQAIYTRSPQAPRPYGPLASQEWGLRLKDVLLEIHGEQQEPRGGPHLQASDVRAVRQGLDRLARTFFENRTVDEYWKGLVCEAAGVWHGLAPANAATTARWDHGCDAGVQELPRSPQLPRRNPPSPAAAAQSHVISTRLRGRPIIAADNASDDEDFVSPAPKRPRTAADTVSDDESPSPPAPRRPRGRPRSSRTRNPSLDHSRDPERESQPSGTYAGRAPRSIEGSVASGGDELGDSTPIILADEPQPFQSIEPDEGSRQFSSMGFGNEPQPYLPMEPGHTPQPFRPADHDDRLYVFGSKGPQYDEPGAYQFGQFQDGLPPPEPIIFHDELDVS